jgi:ribosome modulation factor
LDKIARWHFASGLKDTKTRRRTMKSFSDAYNTGFQAAAQGESRDTNPYLLGTWDSGEWFNGFHGVDVDNEYRIAFPMESGEWDVVEEFSAASDNAANEYAEKNYADKEWFVLDANGKNINGGDYGGE